MRRSLALVALSLLTSNAAVHADLGNTSCPAVAPVVITRVLGERRVEEAELRLTDCFGQPRKQALLELSLLARPHGVPRPKRVDKDAKSLIATSVRRLDPRLLTRLQALATRWPGKRIEIVSGYRPNAKGTSRHRHGRALDLRVVGVDKEEVVAYVKTIPGTGVGYYPNSVFTHVDVREEATTWIDHSGPGERARYGEFPKDFEALLEDAEASKRAARAALHHLQTNALGAPEETSAPKTSSTVVQASSESSEGPSSIHEGLDTTTALTDLRKPQSEQLTDTDDGMMSDDGGRQSDEVSGGEITDLPRKLTQKLDTIETGIDVTQEPAPGDTASGQPLAANQNTSKSKQKPASIDWSPPW